MLHTYLLYIHTGAAPGPPSRVVFRSTLNHPLLFVNETPKLVVLGFQDIVRPTEKEDHVLLKFGYHYLFFESLLAWVGLTIVEHKPPRRR